jgi:hypothetical protein
MAVLIADPLPISSENAQFLPFEWQQQEELDTPRAMQPLKTELKKFGVVFGNNRGLFKLYDVHNSHNLLNLQDEKTGKLSGGTDLIWSC